MAIAAVVDVALHARGTLVSAKALAARHGLAARHFETILRDLVRSGILKGTRGSRGGYELARERRRISIGDIVRAVDKADDEALPRKRPALLHTVILPAMAEATALFLQALDAVSIEDLVRQAEASAIAPSGSDLVAFDI